MNERIKDIVIGWSALALFAFGFGSLIWFIFALGNSDVERCVSRGVDRHPGGNRQAIRHVCEKNPNQF